MAGDAKALGRVLREAAEEELGGLVERHLADLAVAEVRQILLNPFVTSGVIELLIGQPRLLSFYEVRRDLAAHPRTPEVHALRFVSGLFWRDLVRIGRDTRVRPVVRRAADLRLADRLQGLTVGEKMSIARSSGPGVLMRLRHDPDQRVIGALLDNPRLTEGILAPLISAETARPHILALVAEHRRWGSRYMVRVAVCRNPKTPVPTALSLLPSLKKRDLASVASDRRVAAPVRRRADLLLGRAGPREHLTGP